jgi:hypothetical protein
MKAIFTTEKVKYELNEKSYTRNGHSVQGEVKLTELAIGQPAVIELKHNDFVQVIRTDIVTEIKECPIYFKKLMDTEIHPYKISITCRDGSIINQMRIGTETDVRGWLSERYPNDDVTYRITPIPLKRRGVS